MSLNGLSDVALRKDRPEQVGIIRRGQQPAMSGFAGQAVCCGPRRLPRFPKPELSGAGAACPLGQRFCQAQVMGHMVLQRPGSDVPCPVNRPGNPVCPAAGGGIALLASPVAQGRTIGKGGPTATQPKFQIAGQAQVIAPVCPGCRQRVLQQRQQGFRRQGATEQGRHMPQQAAGRRQRQRLACTVIGNDPPPIQRGRHLTRQHPVRRDQCRRPPLFRSLTQDEGYRRGFGPWPRRLDQRHMACGLAQIGQVLAFGQPLIGDRCRTERQRDQPVQGLWRRCGRPCLNGAGRKVQTLQQAAVAELGVIFGRQRIGHA